MLLSWSRVPGEFEAPPIHVQFFMGVFSDVTGVPILRQSCLLALGAGILRGRLDEGKGPQAQTPSCLLADVKS